MASFGFSLAARTIQLVLGFINIMLISRYLGPEQYGSYTFAVNFVLLFTPLIDLSLNHIITREISQNGDISLNLIKTPVYIRLVLFLIILPVILISSKIFSSGRSDLTNLVLIYSAFLLGLCFSSANSYFIAGYKLQRPSTVNILINILNTFTIFVLISIGSGLSAILFSQSIFPFISSVLIYLKVRPYIKSVPLNEGQIKFCLNEVKYLAIAGIFTTIYFKINSAVVFKFLGAESAGNFNAAYKFIDLANPLISVLMMTLFPKINEVMANKSKSITINDMIVLMLLLGAFSSIIVFNFSYSIIEIVYGKRFMAAAPLLRILALSFIMIFTGNIAGFMMIACRMQRQYLFTSFSAAIFNVTALNLIIPEYGARGASAISVLTELLALTISGSLLIRHKQLKPDKKIARALILIIIFLVISDVNIMMNNGTSVSLFIILSFVILCFRCRIIPESILQKLFYEKSIGYNTNL